MNDEEDHREDETGENAGNEGSQKHPPGYFCVFMVLLSEKVRSSAHDACCSFPF
jgi:hypothetical protein